MEKQPFCIAVCDDEPADRESIEEMTRSVCRAEGIGEEISVFSKAEDLLEEIRSGRWYDLLLMDVLMPGLGGMDLARELRRQEQETAIVFVSSSREMALQGYEVAAARYLAKPLGYEKLREAVLFCRSQQQEQRGLLLPLDKEVRKVLPGEICYVEIVGRKSRIWQREAHWDTSLSIRELEGMLPKGEFIRCHQSFLVNCQYVQAFHASSMELSDGTSIPVSKHRIKEVRQKFLEYMKE